MNTRKTLGDRAADAAALQRVHRDICAIAVINYFLTQVEMVWNTLLAYGASYYQ